MASTDHTQGVGFRPKWLTRGGLGGLLDGLRQAGADNRWVEFVAPLGPNVAIVKNYDNPTPYQVANPGGLSFAPGVAVLVGSNAGQAGETLLSGPSLGRKGGATFQAQVLRGGPVGGPPVVTAKGCPAPIRGRTYLALFLGDYAALYEDNHFIRALSPRGSLPVGVDPAPEAWLRAFQWTEGDVVVFATQRDGANRLGIHSWNATTGVDSYASWVATGGSDIGAISAPLALGTFNYFLGGRMDGDFNDGDQNGFQHLQIYRLAIGASGTVSLASATVGPLYDDPLPLAQAMGLCSPAAGVFDCPGLNPGSAIPWLDAGGTWHEGTGRVSLGTRGDGYFFHDASGPSPVNGQPITGGGSLRLDAILLAGGSDKLRAPASWNAIWGDPASGQIPQVSTSVSPSGDEYCIYPVYDRVDPASVDGFGQAPPGLMRLKAVVYPESRCGMPIVQVGPDPDGRYPDIMLARD